MLEVFRMVSSLVARSRSAFLSVLIACVALLLGGCAVPSVEGVIDHAPRVQERVVGAAGPLSPAQSKAVVQRLGVQSDLLQRHLAIEQEIAGTPLALGNRTHLLVDGPATFHAMFAAMKAARRNIYLEYYIFEDVESDGTRLVDLLIEKAHAGVSVAVLYDAYGSVDTPQTVFARLKAAGVTVLEFHPLTDIGTINDRDHRKILAVDNKVAIVGGVNLYTVYQPHPHSRMVASDGNNDPDTWHDTDLEIDGPAAAELQKVFLIHWQDEKGPPLHAFSEPQPRAAGNEAVRIIASDHNDTIPHYYATILSAIRNAEKNIWISAAYFVPTKDEMNDVIAAAQRGVDVRIMLPGHSDEQMAQAVGRAHYGDLLEAGVHIFEEQDGMLHSKWATIDGVWSVVGSSNFDHRSILFNDEVDAVVLGRDTASQLENLFERQVAQARPVTLEAWEHRSIGERFRELYSRALEALL
jgi:cardiolipin synthase A/B